jgi:hypothetical protein
MYTGLAMTNSSSTDSQSMTSPSERVGTENICLSSTHLKALIIFICSYNFKMIRNRKIRNRKIIMFLGIKVRTARRADNFAAIY